LENGAGLKPPLGWSTWKTCGDTACTHDYCDEYEVKSVASAMISTGMLNLGYEYVLLDDCWAMGRDEVSKVLLPDPERFPSGMDGLADWLHARGMKFGIYTSVGNETCSSGGRDIVVPGSEGHFDLDARTFAGWQVDYVKLDYCGNMKNPAYGLPRGKAYHEEFASALLEAQGDSGGRPIFLEVVAGYWFAREEVAGIANGWRFCEDHHDDFGSTEEALMCLKSQRNEWVDVEGKPGGWPYLDLSMIGGEGCRGDDKYVAHCPKQTDGNYKVEWSIWGLMQR
jgi:alpha-galactosidase